MSRGQEPTTRPNRENDLVRKGLEGTPTRSSQGENTVGIYLANGNKTRRVYATDRNRTHCVLASYDFVQHSLTPQPSACLFSGLDVSLRTKW